MSVNHANGGGAGGMYGDAMAETNGQRPGDWDPFYKPPLFYDHPLVWILDDVVKHRDSDVREHLSAAAAVAHCWL